MLNQRTDAATLKGKVDFGIITIREDETEAILQRFPTEEIIDGRQTYSFSRFKTVNDEEYLIACVRCLETGNGQGQSVARDLIEDLDPQWILLIGIGGSIPDYEHTLGDVLLATRVHDFCVSASIEDKQHRKTQQFSSRGGPMHPDVQKLLAALPVITPHLDDWNTAASVGVDRPEVKLSPKNIFGDDQYKKKVRDSLNRFFGKNSIRNLPKAITAAVASSDSLIKDTQLIKQWLDNNRDIKGVEMELAGVYQATSRANKPVLAIRGISDIIGFTRSPDWTSYACHSVASFTQAFLRFRPIVPLSIVRSRQESTIERNDAGILQNQQVSVFKAKPPNSTPMEMRERLFSNLLKISFFPEKLYHVQTECSDRTEVWKQLQLTNEEPPQDWIYSGKTLYAFHDFSDPMWKQICDQTAVESEDTSHWSNSLDQDRIYEFIDLLTGSLKQLALLRGLSYIYKQKIQGVKRKFKYLYYSPSAEFTKSPLFNHDDFINMPEFITTVKDGKIPLTKYVFSNLSRSTQQLITKYPNIAIEEVSGPLVRDLNELLRVPFFDSDLFAGVSLRNQTRKLVAKDPTEREEILRLNRMLFEDVYWSQIIKRLFASKFVIMRSLVQTGRREVFKAYTSDKTGKFRYYRHHAFRFQFLRLDGQWYLEITPTYHYTWDGYRVYLYYENELKGIKKIETNLAVFRQVLFWSRVLQNPEKGLFDVETYPYLRFGELLEFTLDFGLRDDFWSKKESLGKVAASSSKRKGRTNRSSDSSFDLSDFLFD